MKYHYHKDGTSPRGTKTIFVFGSNMAGIHGAGAAKEAEAHYGALRGFGFGPWANSFAIPTKDVRLITLPIITIERFVNIFLDYARKDKSKQFFVTRIGCGLAGYRDEDIAPMFKDAPDNCSFAEEWKPYLEDK